MLNREDPEWFWIVRSDGQEGFIPSGFVYAADNVLQESTKLVGNGVAPAASGPLSLGTVHPSHTNNNIMATHTMSITNVAAMANSNNNLNAQHASLMNMNSGLAPPANMANGSALGASGGTDDLRYHGTELVMLYDYKAQAPDDLSVRRGDWIYADLNNQTVDGWLWAYAPKTRKYGFIPKAYARPPAMTSL